MAAAQMPATPSASPVPFPRARRALWLALIAMGALLLGSWLGARNDTGLPSNPLQAALAYYHVQPERLVAMAAAEIPVEASTPGAYKALGLRVAAAVRGAAPAFETVWRPDLKVIYLRTQSRFGATLISVQPSEADHVARVTVEVSRTDPKQDPAALAVPLERALARGLGFGAQHLQANVALFGRSVSPLLAGGAPRPFGDLPERLGLHGVQIGVAGSGRTLTAYTPFLGRHQAGAQGRRNFALALIPQGQTTRIVAGSPGLDAALLAEADQ